MPDPKVQELVTAVVVKKPDSDLKEEELLSKMPAFFRAIRGQEYTAEDFDKLLSGVKKLHQA